MIIDVVSGWWCSMMIYMILWVDLCGDALRNDVLWCELENLWLFISIIYLFLRMMKINNKDKWCVRWGDGVDVWWLS